MSTRGVGHRPVPDRTNTYCTVPGCDRWLQRGDPTMHRRGSGGRSRVGDPVAPRLPRPSRAMIPALVQKALDDMAARHEALAAAAVEKALAEVLRRTPIAKTVSEQVEAAEQLIADLQQQVDALALAVSRMRDDMNIVKELVTRAPKVVDVRDRPDDWRNQRPGRDGHTRLP